MSWRARLAAARGSRLTRFPLVVAALALALFVSRTWPSDQTVRIILGDAAPKVVEVRLRYGSRDLAGAQGGAPTRDDWLREVSFHYTAGSAPRIVSHQPRIASGTYDIEVELGVVGVSGALRTVTLHRTVELAGATTQVDVASAVRDSLDETPSPVRP